ncbi:InlB B-repeat-containing protein [Fannyhessea vaginae]|uniref:InlB B-repeat-containing protein n=1 Tax=Fannyhessea vaginae TaxID=82135 RepID=UPI00076FA22E|nr:InlB B-repeat-containing protein [Fannyhessea vaginae]KXG91124.1 LPXTG-motif protein cell wall anchor domain protein [Fannyhessea vaginae]
MLEKIADTALGKDDVHFGFGKNADSTYRFALIYKKAGYTFKEWNTKEDGKGEKFTGASVVNGDMTVYAIYTKDPKPDPKTPAPQLQHGKRIDMIPQTGESSSYAGLLAALGFSITGLAILRKKKMMEENK